MKLKRLLIVMFFAMIFAAFCSITAAAEEMKDVTGSSYVIEEGAVYYESSFGFGTGRSAVVNGENIYTTTPCYASINGYSFLDQEGRIIDCKYEEEAKDIYVPEAPEGTAQVFKHFKTANYRNGWVNAERIKVRDESEVESEPPKETANPEEVVKEIQEQTQKGVKTAVVIDYSGSMSEHQRKVLELLGQLEFDENTTIIVFGSTFEVITTKQLANNDFDVGSSTHMYQALNKAISLEVEQMVIISDLQTYEDVKLKSSEKISSVIIYDPLGDEINYVESELKETWKNAKINRTIIR